MRAVYILTQLRKRGCYALYAPWADQIRVYGRAAQHLPAWVLNDIGELAQEIVNVLTLGLDAVEDFSLYVDHTVHNCPCVGGPMKK